ncbi:transcriptional regulator [Pedobacter antarcticus 4BY]|uniref:Transcriptional regulator n=2 Tax=Pedobacter antarcticus TaxID=34086 RepID=A0A081PJX5_9SPHI|nr:DeoR/GlpR family DNA-binding transcription regulator [Pedobacter antarcticus]KEQ30998.1 transcriptional regulator [Pedobacter antarcticus 4BY]SFF21231.1 transcriptional regulator, DeoR family [Pedobacter antarcticus]
MKNSTERHTFILQSLKESGKVSIQELIYLMEVSGVTIRKDLKLLEDKNLLFRTRGGASIDDLYANERTIHEKSLFHREQKIDIAKAALGLIGNHDSISIGSGTTVFELARCLYPQKPLTIITPALKIGLELSNRPHVEVLQLSGLIRPNSSSVAGFYAERILSDISCSMVFLGVDGIDLDFGFSITNLAEAALNQKMIDTAEKVVILADSSKFNKRGLGKICGFDQVHYLVTDHLAPAQMVRRIEEKGVKVIVATA